MIVGMTCLMASKKATTRSCSRCPVFSSDSLMVSDFAATRKLFFISDMVRLIFSATKNDVAFISFSMTCRMAAECVLYVI